MIKVDLWMLVRDWIHERYDHITVTKVSDNIPAAYPTDHLAKIAYEKTGEEPDVIGYAAPKGVLVWSKGESTDSKFDYEMFYATDPKMFEKLELILETYETKESK